MKTLRSKWGITSPCGRSIEKADQTPQWHWKLSRSSAQAIVALVVSGGLLPESLLANPQGGTVIQGKATFSSQGPQLTIQTSSRAFINWQSFNIAPGETTTFQQPSSSSLVWNRIGDANPSQILGNLNANGYVVLQNQNGFYVGGDASIATRGLLMTTAPIPMPDLSSGGAWQFNAAPPAATIVNYGQISAAQGGSVFLIAHNVENQGTITAPQGNVGLYAGKQVLVSERPDGRGLSAKVTLPDGSVDNSGKIIADAGVIAMHAAVVNQGGMLQANSVVQRNGVIELVASDSVNVGSASAISAKGDSDAGAASPGGFVVAKAGGAYADTSTSTITVSGAGGGRDGMVEVIGQGASVNSIHSIIDSGTAAQFLAQKYLLINPNNLTLSLGTTSVATPNSTLNINELSAYSRIDLYADNNIQLSSSWTLPEKDGASSLKLVAGSNFLVDNNSSLSARAGWDVNLVAGAAVPEGTRPTHVSDGTKMDGVYLSGNSFIETQDGDISVSAANEVILGTGAIRTLNGGDVEVSATYGNVNSGTGTAGYQMNRVAPYYTVAFGLSGISTANGGDVTVSAGGNVISAFPRNSFSGSPTAPNFDYGSGAFGSAPGDVTITALGSVFGHFVMANGSGTILAGNDIGSSSQNVALSLVKGDWNLNAPNGSIYLQEVRNPNGVFNNNGSIVTPNTGFHRFDYDPSASVELTAQNGVNLTGSSLPRLSTALVPVIFPPTLTIQAGAGGVTLGNNLTLFPSPYQDLNILTTAGGNFTGIGTPELIMSDSAQIQWSSVPQRGSVPFSDSDHTGALNELNNPDPVAISISGDMRNITLFASKKATISVDGDMVNCAFAGQNLHSGDVTSIDVKGQISNPSSISAFDLSQAIPNIPVENLPPGTRASWDVVFRLAVDPDKIAAVIVPDADLPSLYASRIGSTYLFSGNPGFYYNAAKLTLAFAGAAGYSFGGSSTRDGSMLASVAAALEAPLTLVRYIKYPDGNYYPATYKGQDGKLHIQTDTISWGVATDAINSLYLASQGKPSFSAPTIGYQIGGPGQFNVHAGSISLGNSQGFLSEAAGGGYNGHNYQNLGPVTKSGATLNITVDGNLEMLTSTIAALGGGDVNVTSLGGSMTLGSEELAGIRTSSSNPAFGIWNSGGGNVNVLALGNIDVGGSRIGNFNGGSITVKSLDGNVNAGNGGAAQADLYIAYIDPQTGLGKYQFGAILGSGIISTTYPVSPTFNVPGLTLANKPGDISLDTPRGDIIASQGGILQESRSGMNLAGPQITLTAGSEQYPGNIDLGSAGVIGGSITATANGNITGLIISRENSTISAARNFNGTVLSGGTANLSAGATVSGTVIAVGGVSASGGQGVTATILSQNVSIGGGQSQSTLGSSSSATSTSQAAAQQSSNDAKQQVSADSSSDDEEKKKQGKRPVVTRRVGRVTVILPKA